MMSKEQALHKAELHFSQLKELVNQAIQEGWRADEFERTTFAKLLDLGFELVTAFVAAQGDGDQGSELEHGGKTCQRLDRPHERRYVSIYGPLLIPRYVYGTREGQKIEHVPLDAQLGLPAGEISYVLEDWLERMCVHDAHRESVKSLVALLGVRAKVSVDTSEKHSREMAQHAISFRESQAMPPVDEEGELLVATADGKGVPMRRPMEAQTPQPARHRRGKGEKAQKKQMAYVGAVYTIDRFPRTAEEIVDELLRKQRVKDRPSPQHKHVRAEMTRPGEGLREPVLLHGPSYLFASLALECQARDPGRNKALICLMDGERQFWDLQQEWLPRAVQILDIFHVNQRLWTAAYCFHPENSPAAERFVEHHLRLLLQGRVDTVIRSFRQLLSTRQLRGETRRRLQATITYYDNNRAHMRYGDYLAAGYPIGSGVAEGACRHLVKDRMERTGMRWSLAGAQAMLNLRALYINGDWDVFVEHRIQREQDTLYASSAESVGKFWLGKAAESVKEGDLHALFGTKAICFSDGQFRFVVQTLHRAGGNRPFGTKPIEQQLLVTAQAADHFLQRSDPGALRPEAPFVEKLFGPDWRSVVPEPLKVLAQ